jgi:hypothetical protein
MNTRVELIPNASIDLMWPRILPYVESFCEDSDGSIDPEFVLENLKTGAMNAWYMMGEDGMLGVTLTELRQTKIKEFIIFVCTGEEMVSWYDLIEELEKYARSIGCKKSVAVTREGWKKMLKPKGYMLTHVVLEKTL